MGTVEWISLGIAVVLGISAYVYGLIDDRRTARRLAALHERHSREYGLAPEPATAPSKAASPPSTPTKQPHDRSLLLVAFLCLIGAIIFLAYRHDATITIFLLMCGVIAIAAHLEISAVNDPNLSRILLLFPFGNPHFFQTVIRRAAIFIAICGPVATVTFFFRLNDRLAIFWFWVTVFSVPTALWLIGKEKERRNLPLTNMGCPVTAKLASGFLYLANINVHYAPDNPKGEAEIKFFDLLTSLTKEFMAARSELGLPSEFELQNHLMLHLLPYANAHGFERLNIRVNALVSQEPPTTHPTSGIFIGTD